MSTSQAIFLGAALIAAAIIVSNGMPSARASMGGPYMLEHHSNPSANAGVFRLDTSSGEVSYCYLSVSNELVCSRGIK